MSIKSFGSASLLTRPSLLVRLRDWNDGTSWTEFYRLYRRMIYGMAHRAGLTHPEAEDVVQEVFRHVAEKIGQFEKRPARGSFRRWLMNQTRWRIVDRFRERGHGRRGEDSPADGASGRSPPALDPLPMAEDARLEAEWEEEWQRQVLEAAIERLARRVPAKHLQAFDLSSRQGWPARRVARELGVSTAAVYLYNHRLTKQLRREIERLRATLG